MVELKSSNQKSLGPVLVKGEVLDSRSNWHDPVKQAVIFCPEKLVLASKFTTSKLNWFAPDEELILSFPLFPFLVSKIKKFPEPTRFVGVALVLEISERLVTLLRKAASMSA